MLLDINMSTISSIQAWLGRELELRGIDAMIYTRYILSILQQDNFELEHTEQDVFTPKKQTKNDQLLTGKSKNKKYDKKSLDGEELKKTAAVECLLSVTDEGSGIESLVEEAYKKLKQQKQEARSKSPGNSGEEDDDKGLKNTDPTKRRKKQDPTQRYYEAFPPLSDKLVKGAPPVKIKPEESWSHKVSLSPSEIDQKSEKSVSEKLPASERNQKPPRPFVIYKTKRKDECCGGNGNEFNPYFIVPKMSPTCGKLPTGLLDCDHPAHRKMKEEILRLIRHEAGTPEISLGGKYSNGQFGVDGPQEDWSWYTEPLYKMFPPTSLKKGRLYQRKATADENQNIEPGEPISETDVLQSIRNALKDGHEVWWCTEPNSALMLDADKVGRNISTNVDNENLRNDIPSQASNSEDDVLKCFTTPLPRIESGKGHKASRFLPYILKRMNKESLLSRLSESSAYQSEKEDNVARSLSESDAQDEPVADFLFDVQVISSTDSVDEDDDDDEKNVDDVFSGGYLNERDAVVKSVVTSKSAAGNDGIVDEPATANFKFSEEREDVDSPGLADSFLSMLDWENEDSNENDNLEQSIEDIQKTSVVSQLAVNTEFETIANDLMDELNERFFDWTNSSSVDVGLNSPFLSFRWNLMSPGSTSVWSCRWDSSSTMMSPAQPLERFIRRGLYSTPPPAEPIANKWFETALFLSTSLDPWYYETDNMCRDAAMCDESMLSDAIKDLIHADADCQTVSDIVESLRELAVNRVYRFDDGFDDQVLPYAEFAPDVGVIGEHPPYVSSEVRLDENSDVNDDLWKWKNCPTIDVNDSDEDVDVTGGLMFDWDFFHEAKSSYSHVAGIGTTLGSEFSAFKDQIPRRLPHVKSESDLKPILHQLTRHNSDSNLFAKTAPVIYLKKLSVDDKSEEKEVCPRSPNALYSPQTHFKPIRSLSHDSNSTGNSDDAADVQNQKSSDLIYSYDWVDGYQSYCLEDKPTDIIQQRFVPKFKLNLDGDKCSQTNALSPEKETPPEHSQLSVQHILPEIVEAKECDLYRETAGDYEDYSLLYSRLNEQIQIISTGSSPEYLSDEENHKYNQFNSHFSLSQLITVGDSSCSSRNDDDKPETRGSSQSGSYCVQEDTEQDNSDSQWRDVVSHWSIDLGERDIFHEEREPADADDLDVMTLCNAHIQGDSSSEYRRLQDSDIKTPQLNTSLISNNDTVDQSPINISLPHLDEVDGFSNLWNDEPIDKSVNIWSSGGMSLDFPLPSVPYKEANNDLKSKSLGDLENTVDFYAPEQWSDGLVDDTFAGNTDVFTDEINEQLMTFPSPPRDGVIYSSELEDHWLNSDSSDVIRPKKRRGSVINKPCSFFMEGNCRRKGCRFSHDLSTITCRFWERGECFKDFTCPFLHGYPTASMFDDTDGEQYSDDSGNVTLEADDILSLEIPVSHHLQGNGSRKKRVPLFKRKNGKKNRSLSADTGSKDGDI